MFLQAGWDEMVVKIHRLPRQERLAEVSAATKRLTDLLAENDRKRKRTTDRNPPPNDDYSSKCSRHDNASASGKSKTDSTNFELMDDDESAHQSGSPIAHMVHGDRQGTESSTNVERHLTPLEQGLTEAFPDSPNSTTELFDVTGDYHSVSDSAAYVNSVTRYTVTSKSVATSTKAYPVNRKPPIPYDEIKTCWISFFSGMAPDALFATIAARQGVECPRRAASRP